MEVIKPYKSLIDGKLAFQEGDWSFSKPCHWYFSKKLLKPITHNTYIPQHEIVNRNLVNAQSTTEWQFRNSKRRIPSPIRLENLRVKPSGKKYVVPRYTEPITHPKHVCLNPYMVVKDKVRGAKKFPEKWMKHSFEASPEMEEKVKRKLITHENKYLYKSVEYEPRYFKQEGWVVGSTNALNYNRYAPQNNSTFKSLDLSVKSLDNSKFYAVRESKALADTDINYLDGLNDWDKKHITKLVKKK
jgi:hypothetical protein